MKRMERAKKIEVETRPLREMDEVLLYEHYIAFCYCEDDDIRDEPMLMMVEVT